MESIARRRLLSVVGQLQLGAISKHSVTVAHTQRHRWLALAPCITSHSCNAHTAASDHKVSAPKPATTAAAPQPTTTEYNPNSLWASITGKLAPGTEAHAEDPARGFLPPQQQQHEANICVVLDMDESLIHSEFGSELVSSNIEKYTRYGNYLNKHHQTALDRSTPTVAAITSAKAAAQSPPVVYRFTADDRPFDLAIDVAFDGEREWLFVHTRPHLQHFLQQLQQRGHEVVIFTAATQDYADAVLNAIDTTAAITHRLYRQHTRTHKLVAYVKDLSFIGRQLTRTLIVDNNMMAMSAQPMNGVPIPDYYGGDTASAATTTAEAAAAAADVEHTHSDRHQRNDEHLLMILRMLTALHSESDVRPSLTKWFDLETVQQRLRLKMVGRTVQ